MDLEIASVIMDLNITKKYKSYIELFSNNNIFLYLIPFFKKIYIYTENSKFINGFNNIKKGRKILNKVKINFLDDYNINPRINKVILCNPTVIDNNFWNIMREWSVDNILLILTKEEKPADFITLKKIDNNNLYIHNSFFD